MFTAPVCYGYRKSTAPAACSSSAECLVRLSFILVVLGAGLALVCGACGGSSGGSNVVINTDAGANNGTVNNSDLPFENPCNSGPLDQPIANCHPEPWPSTGDPREDCVRRINQLRWECQCLPPLKRWRDGEACADKDAKNDASKNAAHDGFKNHICSSGWAQNECPGWGDWGQVNSQCIQMMWDEGPGQPYEQHGHYINMSNTQYTEVACGGGDGWFVQNFK